MKAVFETKHRDIGKKRRDLKVKPCRIPSFRGQNSVKVHRGHQESLIKRIWEATGTQGDSGVLEARSLRKRKWYAM